MPQWQRWAVAWAKVLWAWVNLGLFIYIVTGDAPGWAKALAAMIGILGWQISVRDGERH